MWAQSPRFSLSRQYTPARPPRECTALYISRESAGIFFFFLLLLLLVVGYVIYYISLPLLLFLHAFSSWTNTRKRDFFLSFRFFLESANSRCRVLKVLGREEGRGVDRISRTADIFTTRPFLFLRLLPRNTHHDEDNDALELKFLFKLSLHKLSAWCGKRGWKQKQKNPVFCGLGPEATEKKEDINNIWTVWNFGLVH